MLMNELESLECFGSGASSGFPTLAHAPITEAVIDIKVSLPTSTTLNELGTFTDPLRQRFTESKPRMAAEFQMAFGEGAAPQVTSQGPAQDGYFFTAPAENLVAQARLDGFTLSKLKPYESWNTFCQQFVVLWRRYLEVARPLSIKRIALRYINRIELPPGVDLDEYFLTIPKIAEGVPQVLPSFLMRLVVPSETGTIAIITQTIAKLPEDYSVYPVIFDIDVFREVDINPEDIALWSFLKDLRSYKNTVFFRSITPKTLSLFQ
jgi:uncharacterized protein (TIGR04255 family)